MVLSLIIMVILYLSGIALHIIIMVWNNLAHRTGTVLVCCVRAIRSTAPAASPADAPDEFDVQLECGQFRLARLRAPSQ